MILKAAATDANSGDGGGVSPLSGSLPTARGWSRCLFSSGTASPTAPPSSRIESQPPHATLALSLFCYLYQLTRWKLFVSTSSTVSDGTATTANSRSVASAHHVCLANILLPCMNARDTPVAFPSRVPHVTALLSPTSKAGPPRTTFRSSICFCLQQVRGWTHCLPSSTTASHVILVPAVATKTAPLHHAHVVNVLPWFPYSGDGTASSPLRLPSPTAPLPQPFEAFSPRPTFPVPILSYLYQIRGLERFFLSYVLPPTTSPLPLIF